MHPLPWQGAIEDLWSNLAFKKAVIACAWPVAGQAGSPAVQRDASPRISLPTYLIGFGSGGTITYQIAISEAHATFRACVCMGPIRLPSLLPAPTSEETRILVWRTKGRRDLSAAPSDVLLGTGQSSRASCHRSPYRRLTLYCLQGLRTHAVLLGPRPHNPPGGYRQGPGACGVACIAERP